MVGSTRAGNAAMITNCQTDSTSNLRELRLLGNRKGALLRFCKLIFSQTDASIYLIPYAAKRRFFCGSQSMPEKEITKQFDYTDGVDTDREPKLSLHESGQTHVLAAGSRVGPLYASPLENLKGQHVATVCFDQFDGLAPFTGTVSEAGTEQDRALVIEDGVESGRLAVFINAEEPAFQCGPCWITLTLRRPTLKKPLYVGVRAISQARIAEQHRSGVTVIAGWNPTLGQLAHQDYLYLRGE